MARIELRIVGIRAIGSTATLSFPGRARQTSTPPAAKPRIDLPTMRVSAEWNGDSAAVVDIPACDIDTTTTVDRPMPGFPVAQESCFGGDTDGDSFMCGEGVARRKAERPRLVVLPMHVPSVMKTNAGTKGLDAGQLAAGPNAHQRANRSGDGQRGNRGRHGAGVCSSHRVQTGGGKGGGGGGGRYSRADGGRSHCLRVTIGAKPASTFSGGRADASGTFPERSRENVPDFSSERSTNGDGGQTEAFFFERDLLRKEWTEILIPVSLSGHSRLSGCPNLWTHGKRDARPGGMERHTRLRRGLPSKHRQNGYHVEKASPPEVFVVLQTRSAGFHPDKPPLWLVRRDYAERAVRRIISAAAAGVVQPRVEVTLLGLRGAVDALLSPVTSEEEEENDGTAVHHKRGSSLDISEEDENDRIAVHHKRGPSLPRKRELGWNHDDHEHNNGRTAAHPKRGSSSLPTKCERGRMNHDSREEILCQAVWNGKVVHSIRLHRARPPHLESSRPTPIRRYEAALCPPTRTTKVTPELGDASLRGNEDGYPGVSVPSLAAKLGNICDDSHKIAKKVGYLYQDRDKLKDDKPRDDKSKGDKSKDGTSNNQDPTSWFSSGEQPLLDNWVSIGTSSSLTGGTLPGGSGSAPPKPHLGGDLLQQRPGTSATQYDKRNMVSRSPPVWIPAEEDIHNGRSIRFFFPARLFDSARVATTKNKCHGDSLLHGTKKGVCRNVADIETAEGDSDEREVRGNAGVTDDGSDGEGGTMMRGDLRLVFWLISSSAPGKTAAHSVGGGWTGKTGGSRRGAAVVKRKLLGCARLADDELVLQPSGERVELGLLGSAGLGTPTEWAMSHELNR